MTKKYSYKCICNKPRNPWVDLGFMGYNKREIATYNIPNAPQMVKHVRRVFSSYDTEGRIRLDRRNRPHPPDYIITDKPIASHYLQRTERIINRTVFDKDGAVISGRRRNVPKVIEPKFEEVEWTEVLMIQNIDGVNVYELPWTDDLFTELSKNFVYRPDLIKAGVVVTDERPTMDGDDLDGPSADAIAGKKRGRPAKATA